MNGDNVYLTQKDGLDFGIRMNFYANEDRTGIIRITELENELSPADVIANERIRRGLKYKVPSIMSLQEGDLTDEQKEFFLENMDDEKMDDEILEFWQSICDEM